MLTTSFTTSAKSEKVVQQRHGTLFRFLRAGIFLLLCLSFGSLCAQPVPQSRADSIIKAFPADSARWMNHIDSIYGELRLIQEQREEARRKVLESLESLKQLLDSLREAREIYAVTLERDSIDLGEVRRGQTVRFFIRFQNTGKPKGYLSIWDIKSDVPGIRLIREEDPLSIGSWGWVELKYKIPRKASGFRRAVVDVLFVPSERVDISVPVLAVVKRRSELRRKHRQTQE